MNACVRVKYNAVSRLLIEFNRIVFITYLFKKPLWFQKKKKFCGNFALTANFVIIFFFLRRSMIYTHTHILDSRSQLYGRCQTSIDYHFKLYISGNYSPRPFDLIFDYFNTACLFAYRTRRGLTFTRDARVSSCVLSFRIRTRWFIVVFGKTILSW